MTGDDNAFRETSVSNLVSGYILPKILKKYQDRPDKHISDDFMLLMAKHGKEICSCGYSFLYEIALQRISCGACLHKRIGERENLDLEFHEYSTAFDDPYPLTQACYLFLLYQTRNMMNLSKNDSIIKKHASLILFGLIENLSPDGIELFGNTICKNVWPKLVYTTAYKLITENIATETIVCRFATPQGIKKYRQFFAKEWDNLDKQYVAKKLGIKGLFKERKLRKLIFENN